MNIELIEKIKLPYKKDKLIDFAKDYIHQIFPDKDIYLEIIITDDNEMKKLNISYRNINKTADMLSFPIWKNKKEIIGVNSRINLGTIFLNFAKIETDYNIAQKYIIHSIDHLIGKHH